MHVLLCGVFGSGKSSVGKLIANELSATLIELDMMILEVSGVAHSSDLTPAHWKECQIDVCKDLSAQSNLVIAASGNIIENDINILHFREHDPQTVVVYLQASVDTLARRVVIDTQENLAEVKERLSSMLTRRDPLYRLHADIIIETDTITPAEVATQIISFIRTNFP